MEKILYNGLLSGVGLDGKSFFYTNAMQVTDSFNHGSLERQRSGWFECSCCPTNMLRLLPSLPGYMYAQKGHDLYINLFISSNASLNIDGQPVQVVQENNYPWNGALSFTLLPASPRQLTVRIRIPGWARGQAIPSDLYAFEPNASATFGRFATSASAAGSAPSQKIVIRVNGQPVDYKMDNGYALLDRNWQKGDRITMNLPMPTERVVANPLVKEDAGKVSIQRGPLVYCAEWKDNKEKLSKMLLLGDPRFTPAVRPDLLGGITVLNGTGAEVLVDHAIEPESSKLLYKDIPVTLIPYYAWANRGEGEMKVWFPSGPPSLASQ